MAKLNLVIHVIWAAIFFSLLNRHGWPETQFDSVSVGLTILEITLIAGGVFAFLELRNRAERTARTCAEEICPEIVEEHVLSYMNDKMPSQLREHVETIVSSMGQNDDAYGVEEDDENKS